MDALAMGWLFAVALGLHHLANSHVILRFNQFEPNASKDARLAIVHTSIHNEGASLGGTTGFPRARGPPGPSALHALSLLRCMS